MLIGAAIVVGHHFKSPWREPAPVRLYLHRGVQEGNPVFEETTQQAGLTPLAMKAPHVEIQDFDNDGWPDIFVSIVKFKDGAPYPVIFRNQGVQAPIPQFRDDAWAVNDFPAGCFPQEKRKPCRDVHRQWSAKPGLAFPCRNLFPKRERNEP